MDSYYAKAMAGFLDDDKYYEGELEDSVELPEGFDITIPTTARAVVDEAVDNVEPYDILIDYAPRSFGKTAQEDAEKVSRFLRNIWMFWRQKNSDIDVVRDFIKNLFKNGKACFKVVPDLTLWPSLSEDEEEELMQEGGLPSVKERVKLIKQLRKENFPITIRSLSPRHFYEDPTMDARKLWVVETYELSNEEVRNRFADLQEEFRDPDVYSVVIKELWTATWVDWNGRVHKGKHWIFIDEHMVHREENPYHDIPYVIKHSGFGTETYDGKPEQKAVGFFSRQVKSMLRAEVRRVTHFDSLMAQLAFPILMVNEILEDIGFDTAPGAVNYVPQEIIDAADKMFIQAKLPDAAYMQSINMIQSQIERGTTQRAIRGAGVPGTDSAAQLAMITAQAKLRLEPIKRATEEAVDMCNSLVLRYIDSIFEDSVSVFGAEPNGPDTYVLKPDQIRGRYKTRTRFMPNDEQTKERKLVLVTDAITKAGLNPYDAFVFAGWENPMEVIARNMAYKLMQEPAIMRQLAKEALTEWGLDSTEVILEEMNDNAFLQQMMAEMQNRMQGMGQAGPGEQLAGNFQSQQQQQGMTQQQQAANRAPRPQATGAPLATPNQDIASIQQVYRQTGALSG